MPRRIAALSAVLALSLAPCALADGDPASDVLPAQDAYYPYSPPASKPLVEALNALLAQVRKDGFPIKVAMIETAGDLGSYPTLLNAPQRYADLLSSELPTNPHGGIKEQFALLVVMPGGFGGQRLGDRVDEALNPITIDTEAASDGLVRAALEAVARLATVNGHETEIPPEAAVPGSGGGTSVWTYVGPGAGLLLVLLVAVFVAPRRRRSRRAGTPEPVGPAEPAGRTRRPAGPAGPAGRLGRSSARGPRAQGRGRIARRLECVRRPRCPAPPGRRRRLGPAPQGRRPAADPPRRRACSRSPARRCWPPRTRPAPSRRCCRTRHGWPSSPPRRRSTSPSRSRGSPASASTPSTSAGRVSLVCRAIPVSIKTLEELALPPVLRELAEEERGIVLLTGTTGSGKSTTLAAMIDHINTTMAKHVVTIEDPIEFLHTDKRSLINQREIGTDTGSFGRALRRVLRQDPDVILIGEMRDEETVHTALSAAETGHLVLSTIHTVDAAESVNRMIDNFSPHMHGQVRAMLAGTLKGVVSQRLVPAADGGRVAAAEIMRMTGRIRDMIMDPAQTGRLGEVIADGGYYGMQTFDQALFAHVKSGRVTVDDALAFATSPHDFKLLLAADGKRGTTMDDLAEAQERRAADVPLAAGAPGR